MGGTMVADWNKYRLTPESSINLVLAYQTELTKGHVLAESVLNAIDKMQPITSGECAAVALAQANIAQLFWMAGATRGSSDGSSD
jgi:hypothetical protein